MTPLEILAKAKKLIEQDGWVQGWYGDPESGWCATGALLEAVNPSHIIYPSHIPATLREPYLAAIDALRLDRYVPEWNDMAGRTKDEVLAAFEQAITNNGERAMKRYVEVGEIFAAELPYSEVCMHMQVAGKTMPMVLIGHKYPYSATVQLLNPDGSNFSFPISLGEAGIHNDELLVEPEPEQRGFYYYENES